MSKNDVRNSSPESEPAKEDVPETAVSTTVPTPTASPDVLDAEALVAGIVSDIPTLGYARPLLANVAALLSYERRNDPIGEALDELKAAGITARTIRPGINAMKKEIAAMALKAVDAFNEKAGEDRQVSLATLDPKPALDAEVNVEQKGLREEAVKLLGRAQKLSTDLFAEDKPQSLVSLILGAASKFDESLRRDPEPVPSAELPGWKTPPKLNKEDSRVVKLYDQIGLFEKNWDRFKDRSKTLAQLKTLTFEAVTVKAILEAAVALANEQLIQSATIEGVATAETATFVTQAQKIAANQVIADQAEKYLDSAK